MLTQARAGVYERVSRVGDKRSASIEEQNADNRQACDREEWTIVRTFQDAGRSASRFVTYERPAYIELLAAIRGGELDVVVLWESSRGGRELESWAAFLKACREHNVKVYVTSHGHLYDLSVGRDWRTLAEDGVDSAYESEKTSDRMRRSRQAHAEAGRLHGLAPYGYLRNHDERTGALIGQEPDPQTAPVVEDIVYRVAGGKPIEAVTRDLNARQIPSPRGGLWTHATVRWICMNITYVSKRKHNGGPLLDGNWPPVSTRADFEETFWSGVSLLSAESRKLTRPGRARWLLSFVATCAKCGGVVAARETRDQMRYVCRDHGCFYIAMDEVDARVTKRVVGLLSRPDTYAKIAATDDRAVLSARAEAARLRGELADWEAAAIAGTVTPASFGKIEAGLLARIQEQESAAASASVPAALRDMLAPGANIKVRWAALEIPARKDVLRTLFASITIAPATDRRRGAPFDPARVQFTNSQK